MHPTRLQSRQIRQALRPERLASERLSDRILIKRAQVGARAGLRTRFAGDAAA